MLESLLITKAMRLVDNKNVYRQRCVLDALLNLLYADVFIGGDPAKRLDLQTLTETLNYRHQIRAADDIEHLVEACLQLALPFGSQASRHDDEDSFNGLARTEPAKDVACLDRLPEPDVVSNQQTPTRMIKEL